MMCAREIAVKVCNVHLSRWSAAVHKSDGAAFGRTLDRSAAAVEEGSERMGAAAVLLQ